MTMNVEDYLQWLEEEDLRYFSPAYDAFWVDTVCELMATIGPDTDAHLEKLTHQLQTYYRTRTEFQGEVEGMWHEISRQRGTRAWLDDSVLGLKYQVLNAMAGPRVEPSKDIGYWLYGIVTAFQRMNLPYSEEKEAMLLDKIQRRLQAFASQHPFE